MSVACGILSVLRLWQSSAYEKILVLGGGRNFRRTRLRKLEERQNSWELPLGTA